MASTFSLATVLLICVCFAAGQDIQLSCPDKMKLATVKHYNPVTLTCTINKSAYASVCNIITNVEFYFTKEDGSRFLWSEVKYDCNPTTGTFTTTSTCFRGEVKCTGVDATYSMSFYPSMEITNGSFSCDVNCILKPSEIKPALTSTDSCKDVIPVDACGGCPDDKGCDENVDPPTCVKVEIKTEVFICVVVILFILIVVLIIIIILLCAQPSCLRRMACCACCMIGMSCCCALCKIVEENEKPCQKCGTRRSETSTNTGRSTAHDTENRHTGSDGGSQPPKNKNAIRPQFTTVTESSPPPDSTNSKPVRELPMPRSSQPLTPIDHSNSATTPTAFTSSPRLPPIQPGKDEN